MVSFVPTATVLLNSRNTCGILARFTRRSVSAWTNVHGNAGRYYGPVPVAKIRHGDEGRALAT